MPGSDLRVYGYLWDTPDGRSALLCADCAEALDAETRQRLDADLGPPRALFYWDLPDEDGAAVCDRCGRPLEGIYGRA